MIPIADSHCDFLSYHVLEKGDSRLHDQTDLVRMRRGGVRFQVFAVWVPPEHENRLESGFRQIEYLQGFIAQSGGQVRLCTRKAHLGLNKSIAAVLAIESGESMNCSLEAIEEAYLLGVRMLSLTWNGENAFACGCGQKGGLKPLGREAISLMNTLHMALDVSHLNEEGFWEAIDAYSGSPCASHSSAFALCAVPRNLNDRQIEAIILRGGYMGINFYTEFLRGKTAGVEDVLAHIEHVLSLGGMDTVGFGSDFCGIQYTPEGLGSAADFQALPEAMVRRGYPESLIKKICYGNYVSYILKFLE